MASDYLMSARLFFFILCNVFFTSANASDAITIFAASSLTLPLNEITSEYEKQNKQKISISYAASSSLARQILYGAPTDIYISANQKWMNFVEQHELVEKKNIWISNRLVLVSRKNENTPDKFDIQQLAQFSKQQYIAIADPNHVPLGIYSKEALQSYNLWQNAVNHAVFTRNARATLALVERGETDFGIVYYSDVLASSSKVQYNFPIEKHSPINYSKSLIKNASTKAQKFYQYLDNDTSKRILLKYGFTLIEN